jgi:peptide/nickel transport system ATP-binding protein/oligopeptide transport system ATP-binding protein
MSQDSKNGAPLLEVRNLRTHFPVLGGLLRRPVAWVKAVDDVSFQIRKGETFGLVGESGCGKTTLGRSIVRLNQPQSGQILFEGTDVAPLRGGSLKRVRREVQMIFQDPYGSLNPRMKVGELIAEGLQIQGGAGRSARMKEAAQLAELVGLRREHLRRYAHEFSGGQRQRIGIARALALKPKLVIADEPVSALDVSIQSQVLNLLSDLQAELGLSYLFIAHDLGVVEYVSDRVGVMYLGRLVELASSEDLYADPRMPYTQALLSAIPTPDRRARKERIVLRGEVPSPLNPPSGCPFRTRCWLAQDVCAEETPPLREIKPGHLAACHFAESTSIAGSAALSAAH